MRAMPRVASIYLPTWSTDRMMRQKGAAAPDYTKLRVLVGKHRRQRTVTAVNGVAAGLEFRPGIQA
jgi:protein ImuB